MHSGSERPVAN